MYAKVTNDGFGKRWYQHPNFHYKLCEKLVRTRRRSSCEADNPATKTIKLLARMKKVVVPAGKKATKNLKIICQIPEQLNMNGNCPTTKSCTFEFHGEVKQKEEVKNLF